MFVQTPSIWRTDLQMREKCIFLLESSWITLRSLLSRCFFFLAKDKVIDVLKNRRCLWVVYYIVYCYWLLNSFIACGESRHSFICALCVWTHKIFSLSKQVHFTTMWLNSELNYLGCCPTHCMGGQRSLQLGN